MIGMIHKDRMNTTMMLILEIIPNCANFSELVKVTNPTAVVKFVRKVTDPMRRIMMYKALVFMFVRTYS
jgi:hypothetical protein